MGAPLDNPHDSEDEDYDEDFEVDPIQAVTCGQPMTEGRHYWEVEYTSDGGDDEAAVMVGAVRPDQDCDDTGNIPPSSTAHFMLMSDQGGDIVRLCGNGKSWDVGAPGCDGDVSHVDEGEEFIVKEGDRIGCLLDLDAGWLRFYRNGVRLKQEYASGVTGPLLRSLQVYQPGVVWTALPGAETPLRLRTDTWCSPYSRRGSAN